MTEEDLSKPTARLFKEELDFISEDDSDNWQELSHLETHEAKSIAFPPML